MQKLRAEKGITLIALVITIIVMLILVGVSVTVALNGGLFTTAKEAAEGTATERDNELSLSDGKVEINGEWYKSIDDYLNNKPLVILPESWEEIEKPETWISNKVIAIKEIATDKVIPLPEGFKISEVETEQTIESGLVIKNGENEFVWIPVTNAAAYTEDGFGPLTDDYIVNEIEIGEYDSYQTIQYLYGNLLGEITDETSFNKTFTYEADKTSIEQSIRTYGGFYVGRYETTYDSRDENNVPQGIGVKRNKSILTSNNILQSGKNTNNNESYYCRWWGLYKAQKDMYAASEAVFSTMITSKQWDEIMKFTGYSNGSRGIGTYKNRPEKSASAYSTDSSKYDVSKNIYDLAGNVMEFTLTCDGSKGRFNRGGGLSASPTNASDKYSWYRNPDTHNSYFGSRVALYIK